MRLASALAGSYQGANAARRGLTNALKKKMALLPIEWVNLMRNLRSRSRRGSHVRRRVARPHVVRSVERPRLPRRADRHDRGPEQLPRPRERAAEHRRHPRSVSPATRRARFVEHRRVERARGLDALVHGPSRLHGWGAARGVDNTLLAVREFDPQTQSFSYAVNPAFGGASITQRLRAAPFTLTLDFRVSLAPDPEAQAMDALIARSGGADAGRIRAQLLGGPNFDQIGQLLQQLDSLGLSSDQIAELRRIHTEWAAERTAAYSRLAQLLADYAAGRRAAARRSRRGTRRSRRSGARGSRRGIACAHCSARSSMRGCLRGGRRWTG